MIRTLLSAVIFGAAFALFELARLKFGGMVLTIPRTWPVIASYSVLAGLVAGAIGGACGLVRRVVGLSPRLSGLLSLAPLAGVLFLFTATWANILWLPSRTSLLSLAVDLALMPLALASVWAWSKRPRRRLSDSVAAAVVGLLLIGVYVWVLHDPVSSRPMFNKPGSGKAASGSSPGAPAERPPNIVVVLVDTLRADHLGFDGYGYGTSPFLDDLARRAWVFDNAYSTSNWTRPAVASLLTSTMPSRHGATVHHLAPAKEFRLLAEPFQEAGYSVGFFTSGVNVEEADGYGRGVDYFYSAARRDLFGLTTVGRQWIRPVLSTARRLRSERRRETPFGQVDPANLVSRALDWVDQQARNRPVLLYVHLHGPHSPYDPPAPFDRAFSEGSNVQSLMNPLEPWVESDALPAADRRQMIAQYDGEILWHDREIANLFNGLRESHRLDPGALVVTADHGEAFGEHETWGHNAALFDEIIRIPLLIWSSEAWSEPRQISTVVSLIDLAPTLLDVAGIEAEPSFDGSSILPWIRRHSTDSRFVFFENPENDEIGVRTDLWSYFEGETAHGFEQWLYRADDDAQIENLADRFPGVVAELRELALARRDSDRNRAVAGRELELEPSRIEELKALGYLQ